MLHSGQRKVYDFLEKNPEVADVGIYACRKIGKSVLLCIYGIEQCMRTPNFVVRHVLPSLKGAKDVVVPVMGEIMPYLPDDVRPVYFASVATYKFPNGSQYILCGAHADSLEGARGPRCDVFLFDEVCFFDSNSYMYGMQSVFMPQQTLVERPRRVYASTPPVTPDHPFIINTLPKIEAKNAFFRFTVYDNPLISPDKIQELKEEYGEGSNAWKREYLAELVVDDNLRVVPEFDRVRHSTLEVPPEKDSFGAPCKYRGYQVADFGVGDEDFTGILAGVFDHNRQKLVITAEHLMHKPIIDDFVAEWEKMQGTHLSDAVEVHKTIDAFESLRFSFRHQYNLSFSNPRKGKVQENVAFLRNCFENDKIEILDTCPQLKLQLQNGVWKENLKDFARSQALGHLDLLICLVYMVRAVDWDFRPGVNRINLRLGTMPTQRKQNAIQKRLRNLR